MRIISSTHDYYDSVQKYGQDQSIIYLRERKEVNLSVPKQNIRKYTKMTEISKESFGLAYNLHFNRWSGFDQGFSSLHIYIIGFCGKIYPCVQVQVSVSSDDYVPIVTQKYCYKIEEIDEFVKKYYKSWVWDEYITDKYYRKHQWAKNHRRKNLNAFFELVNNKQNDFSEKFISNRTPIIVENIREEKLIYNEILKQYEFYRIFDTNQAGQELSMWFGNLAAPEKPIPHIDDKTMAQAKGFDKFSFRKDKKK